MAAKPTKTKRPKQTVKTLSDVCEHSLDVLIELRRQPSTRGAFTPGTGCACRLM